MIEIDYVEVSNDEIKIHMTQKELENLLTECDGDTDKATNLILEAVFQKILPDVKRGGHTKTVKRRKNNDDCDHCIYKIESEINNETEGN